VVARIAKTESRRYPANRRTTVVEDTLALANPPAPPSIHALALLLEKQKRIEAAIMGGGATATLALPGGGWQASFFGAGGAAHRLLPRTYSPCPRMLNHTPANPRVLPPCRRQTWGFRQPQDQRRITSSPIRSHSPTIKRNYLNSRQQSLMCSTSDSTESADACVLGRTGSRTVQIHALLNAPINRLCRRIRFRVHLHGGGERMRFRAHQHRDGADACVSGRVCTDAVQTHARSCAPA
jgi:hypothetical protein